jgi:hypothetical protein
MPAPLLLLFALAAPAAPVDADDAARALRLRCAEARLDMMLATRQEVVAGATRDAAVDADPDTVQFFVVADLAIADSHVSADGQGIWIALAAMEGPHADPTLVADLYKEAMSRRVKAKLPECAAAAPPPADTDADADA